VAVRPQAVGSIRNHFLLRLPNDSHQTATKNTAEVCVTQVSLNSGVDIHTCSRSRLDPGSLAVFTANGRDKLNLQLRIKKSAMEIGITQCQVPSFATG
jgi:hypothetical protein